MLDHEFYEITEDIILGFTKLLKFIPKDSKRYKLLAESVLLYTSFVAYSVDDDQNERIDK